MKVRTSTTHQNGKVRMSIELEPGEKLVVVRNGAYYRLGQPCEDQVLHAHIIEELTEVTWCPIEQRWTA